MMKQLKSMVSFKILTATSLLWIFLFSFESSACRIIPIEKNKNRHLLNLIRGSSEIYWAKAVSASEQDETVTFKVIEVMRGEKKETVVLDGKLASDTDVDSKNDYKSHRDPKFWDSSFEGRTKFDKMCRLNPQFTIGERYLILNKKPNQPKSFEIVKSSRDQWYQLVRNTIYPASQKKPTNTSSDYSNTAIPTKSEDKIKSNSAVPESKNP
jgi:hypothetical protein